MESVLQVQTYCFEYCEFISLVSFSLELARSRRSQERLFSSYSLQKGTCRAGSDATKRREIQNELAA